MIYKQKSIEKLNIEENDEKTDDLNTEIKISNKDEANQRSLVEDLNSEEKVNYRESIVYLS